MRLSLWKTAASAALALTAVAQVQAPAAAQAYPAKPVRWIVASAPGGAFDLITRGIAPAMSTQTGQTFFVDSIGGAAGVLGMDTAARAAPDGYTILTAGVSQLVFNQFFHKSLPYDTAKDYDAVTLVGELPIALWISTSVGVRTFPELVKYLKANPGKLNYGSAGVGHLFHLAMEMLEDKAGITATHVPYKGVGPAVQDFLAGRIELLFSVVQRPIVAQWKAGKVAPLVGGTDQRLRALPDVPTFSEMGIPGMDLPNWVGVVVPKGTPRDIVARLNREFANATQSEAAQKAYAALGMERVHTTPEQFDAKYRKEIAFWGPFIKKLGIGPQ
jgi:tripartite-type tricarboxylate transporter receptor subunit TctC